MKWNPVHDECQSCGAQAEIWTQDDQPDGYGYDGDIARCPECGETGWFSCDDGYGYVCWHMEYESAEEGGEDE